MTKRIAITLISSLSTGSLLIGCSPDQQAPSTAEPDTTQSSETTAAQEANDAMADADVVTDAATDDATVPAAAMTMEPVELATIARAHRLGDIYLTSQPSQDDFFAVRDAGIKTVVNQRHDRENSDFVEKDVVTELGMEYHSLAFGAPEELTDELLDRHREMFRNAPKPMLIHCASANRTGSAWLAYCVLDRGISMEEALEEARMVGLRTSALEDVVKAYIERKQAQGGEDQ